MLKTTSAGFASNPVEAEPLSFSVASSAEVCEPRRNTSTHTCEGFPPLQQRGRSGGGMKPWHSNCDCTYLPLDYDIRRSVNGEWEWTPSELWAEDQLKEDVKGTQTAKICDSYTVS